MPVPNSDLAFISPEKLAGYLLNHDHPTGAAKARWFNRLGYDLENLATFEQDLLRLVRESEEYQALPTQFGWKYVVEGELVTPVRTQADVVSVWIVELPPLRDGLPWSVEMRFAELEIVVLTHDIPSRGLRSGDVGTIVHAYPNPDVFEVEFTTGGGETLAVETLKSDDLRALGSREILHAREIVA